MMKLKKLLIVAMAFMLPAMASAQYYISGGADADTLLGKIRGWIPTITTILVALAILMTIYNAFKLITAKDDSERKEAKSALIASLIAIAVILGFMAIALALLKTAGLGVGGDVTNYIPTVTFQQ